MYASDQYASRVEMKQLLRSTLSWNIVRDAGSVEN